MSQKRLSSFLFLGTSATAGERVYTFYAPTAKKAAEYAVAWAKKNAVTLLPMVEKEES